MEQAAMDNPFNLTKCNKLSLRRRTLGDGVVHYHTYFEPRGLDKYGRRFAIDSFKHPKTREDRNVSDAMITYSINEFLKVYQPESFDIIIGLPSSSGVVKRIVSRLLESNISNKAFLRGFDKTRMRNVKLKQWMIDRESSEKTKEKVPESFEQSKRLHYDKVSKSSLFPTRFRRYIENIIKLNIPIPLLYNKNVLLVDDTFGEGLTLCEASGILQPHCKSVIGFTVMKDICAK